MKAGGSVPLHMDRPLSLPELLVGAHVRTQTLSSDCLLTRVVDGLLRGGGHLDISQEIREDDMSFLRLLRWNLLSVHETSPT